MQQAVVILIVAACGVWLGVMAYRYFRPTPGGGGCAGGCCDGREKPAQENAGTRTMMVSSDDLRARLKARNG